MSALSHHIVYRKEERVGGRGEEGRVIEEAGVCPQSSYCVL